jgi:hypothetical protein
MIGSTLCISVSYAEMPTKEFQEILNTLKTYDLNNANEEGFRYYISLVTRVDQQGSEMQKAALERMFHEEPAAVSRPTDRALIEIQDTLKSNVISQGAWNNLVKDIGVIETHGSPTQIETAKAIIVKNSDRISATIKNIINSTVQNVQVQDILKTVVIGTVYGVVPGIAFKGLSILSGNLDIATATTDLIDVGVVSALDTLARYALQKTSDVTSASFAGATSVAVQDFFGYMGSRPSELPLMGPIGRPLLAMIQGAGLTMFKQELNRRGGAPAILTHINWRDMAVGPEEGAIVEQSDAFNFIKTTIAQMIQNKTVQSAVATTITYAAEGALMGAVMHTLGLGFYEESGMTTALTQSMIRGAIEGLYHFSVYKEQPVGALQRLHGGFVARTVQQVIQRGSNQISLLSITPIVVQQLSTSAINSIVRTTGGWSGLMKKIFNK